MGERELIYREDVRRALLRNAPDSVWCLNSIRTAAIEEEKRQSCAKQDEFWVARIKYWPGADTIVTVVKIYYAWHDGAIQFVPFGGDDSEPIWATNCQLFELLEKVEVEKYK